MLIAAAATGATTAAAPAKKEEKKEEEAADVDMGGLFGDDYWKIKVTAYFTAACWVLLSQPLLREEVTKKTTKDEGSVVTRTRLLYLISSL